jgi:hypothetical protein
MNKDEVIAAVSDVRERWEAVFAELGPAGLERAGATGAWRVRDVVAHANCWDRWQLVQLRCAFTGETPTEEELHGGLTFPPNDDMSDDAMNAMFYAGNKDRPLDDVLADHRELSAMRASWLADASQERLDTIIGSDWAGGTERVFRLASEVPTVSAPEQVWERIHGQVAHHALHLDEVRAWMLG